MRFEGDIIITDPCYIDTEDRKLWDHPKMDYQYGEILKEFGFTNFIWRDTVIGDWSWNTYQIGPMNTLKPIGKFCADAGLVGVFLLDEVLRFNPKFDFHTERTWTTTLIKGFAGDVEYELVDEGFVIKGKGNINFVAGDVYQEEEEY